MSESKPFYSEEQLLKLTPMDHVRLRPGMYFGGTDIHALHYALYCLFDEMVSEAMARRGSHIWIMLCKDNEVCLKDNGIGLPVEKHRLENKSMLELIMTEINARWGMRKNGDYDIAGGLHGLGQQAANAVSAEMIVEVARDDYLWRQTYKAGKRQTDVIQIRPLAPDESTGTTITFTPDFTVFEPNEFSFKMIAARCQQVAYTVSNLTITLRDERLKKPKEGVFHYENGMADLVRDLNRKRTPSHPVIHSVREMTITPEGKNPYTVEVDVALQFTNTTTYRERSYANTLQTVAGGTHVEGLRAAIRDFINAYARNVNLLGNNDADLSNRQVQRGLTVALSIKHPHPTFESWSIIQLLNTEMHEVVAAVVREALDAFAAQHPDDLRRIVERMR